MIANVFLTQTPKVFQLDGVFISNEFVFLGRVTTMLMMMVVIVTGMVLLLLPPTIGTVIVVMLIQGLRGGQSLPASLGGLVRVLLINQPNLSKLSDVP